MFLWFTVRGLGVVCSYLALLFWAWDKTILEVMCDRLMEGRKRGWWQEGVREGKWKGEREKERQKRARKERGRGRGRESGGESSLLGTTLIPQGHAPSDLFSPTWPRLLWVPLPNSSLNYEPINRRMRSQPLWSNHFWTLLHWEPSFQHESLGDTSYLSHNRHQSASAGPTSTQFPE